MSLGISCPPTAKPDRGGWYCMWDLASGRCEHTLEGHTDAVWAAAVTADGARTISASDDGTLRVWDLASGRCEHTLQGHTDWVRAVAVTADGARAISASDVGTLRVWNVTKGQEIARWICDPGVIPTACCSVPTDPKLLIHGDHRGGVNILRLNEPAVRPQRVNR